MFKHTEKITHNKTRRGATLVELTIVLAMLAIISAVVVSFSALISQQTNTNQQCENFMSSAAAYRNDLQTQFANLDGNGATITDVQIFSLLRLEDYPDVTSCHVQIIENAPYVKITLSNDDINTSLSFLLVSRLGSTFISEVTP